MGSSIPMVKKAIRDGNLCPKAICSILIKTGISNSTLQALEVRNMNLNYVRKKYSPFLMNIDHPKTTSIEGRENVWICWLQGMDKAPKLVQACVRSVYKYMPEKKVHIITSENMDQYVKWPEWIKDKWKKGVITNTHLSDLLRMELLSLYGGLWLDATIFLTGKIPGYIYNSKLFMYSHCVSDDITIKYNSFLIMAAKDDRVIKTIRDLLFEYWRTENKIREYFLLHLFTTMVCERYPSDFKDMIWVPDAISNTLSRVMMDDLNEQYWEDICHLTPIHKLTYKCKIPKRVEGTYYWKILHPDL